MRDKETAALAAIKAAADRNRLRILKLLQIRPMCVCELTAVLGIAQPSVSRHLMLLRNAGLVADQRDGQWIEYRLAAEGGSPAADLLDLLGGWLEGNPQVEADRKAAAKACRDELGGSGVRKCSA